MKDDSPPRTKEVITITDFSTEYPNTGLFEEDGLAAEGRFEPVYAEFVRTQCELFVAEASQIFRGISSFSSLPSFFNCFAVTPVAPRMVMIARHSFTSGETLRLSSKNHVSVLYGIVVVLL